MKKQDLQQLSKKLSVSKATVSKVINHCPGVEHETRKKVLNAVEKLNIEYNIKSKADIYVITPHNPKYFWSQAYRGLVSEADLSCCKFNVYSKLHDVEEVKIYIQQAYSENAKIIIIAVAYNPEIFKLLETVAQKIPIFFLGEYYNIPNTFYIGNNSYDDGASLGKVYLEHFSKYGHIICLELEISPNTKRRVDGFESVVKTYPIQSFRRIQIPLYQKSLASLLALQLNEVNNDAYFNCIYCTSGILPQICMAINKLKLKRDMICIGFENPSQNDSYINNGLIGAIIEQDVFMQGKEAMTYAVKYIRTLTLPPAKNLYVPSKLIVNNAH